MKDSLLSGKLIVAGSRTFKSWPTFVSVISNLRAEFVPTEIISGRCKGPDQFGERWARDMGIPIDFCPARWEDLTVKGCVIKMRPNGDIYNAAAGHIRNREMAEKGDALLAFWDGVSTGTAGMIHEATIRKLHVWVYYYASEIPELRKVA